MTERLKRELVALFGGELVAEAERLELSGVTAAQARKASNAAANLRKLQRWPRAQRSVVEALERPAALLLCRRLMDPGITREIIDGVYSNDRSCTPDGRKAMEVLMVEEVAEILKIKAATVRKLFRDGELPGRKVGRDWRTTKEALENYMNQLGKREGA